MNDGYTYYIDENTSADSLIVQRAFDIPNTVWTYTTNKIDWCCHPYESHKHFNCKQCGAPNQVDVCEYCGSAPEE